MAQGEGERWLGTATRRAAFAPMATWSLLLGLALPRVAMADAPGNGKAAPAASAKDASAPAASVPGPDGPAFEALPAVPTAVVRFHNVGPGVTLRVEGGPWWPLGRGEHRDVEATAPVLRYTVARGTEWQYGGSLDLQATPTRLVALHAPMGHIEVTNRSDEPCNFTFDDKHIALLDRDETRLLGPLPVGSLPWACAGSRSQARQSGRLTLTPGGRREILISPTALALHVDNPSDEPVRVIVDARDYGRLEPRSATDIVGLVAGRHEVVLRGLRTGREVRAEQDLRRSAAQRDATAVALTVINATGEALQLAAALSGVREEPIPDGAEVRLVLSGRPLRLVLRGDDSQLDYARNVDPRRGSDQRWQIERPTGRLLLRNATGAEAAVEIADRPAVRVRRDASLRVRGVPAGKVVIRVRPADGAAFGGAAAGFERAFRVEPGMETAVTLRAGRSELVVANQHQEPVEIAIDGVPRGQISGGGSFRAVGIAPGPHTVHALTVLSRRREAATVVVADGSATTCTLQPPDAAVRVQNDGEGLLTVLLAGQPIGTVKAGHERGLPVPAGMVTIEVRDEQGHALTWSGRIAPGQSLPLPAPRAVGSGVVVDNPTAGAIAVRLDERGAWQAVAPGDSYRPPVGDGEHLIELRHGRDQAGEPIEERRRVRVAPGSPDYRLAPILSR